MHRLKKLLASALVAYVACGLLMMLVQRHLLYLPQDGPTTPQEAGLSGFERHYLTTADGLQLPYWEHESPGPIVLYFHGNGDGLYAFTGGLDYLARHHFHVVAMEYRGFPGAPGHSSETALVADGAALYDTMKARYPRQKPVFWGYSLGSGVATELAAERPPAALVLEAPFSAAVDVAAEIYPIYPVRWMMLDQFRSRDFIPQVHAPVFIMHGVEDNIVPIALGKALYAKANDPKTFRSYPHAGHMTLQKAGAYEDAMAFLHTHVHQ